MTHKYDGILMIISLICILAIGAGGGYVLGVEDGIIQGCRHGLSFIVTECGD